MPTTASPDTLSVAAQSVDVLKRGDSFEATVNGKTFRFGLAGRTPAAQLALATRLFWRIIAAAGISKATAQASLGEITTEILPWVETAYAADASTEPGGHVLEEFFYTEAEVDALLAGVPTLGAFNDHSARHENGGADEISVAGLSGLLADPQTPLTHSHPKSEISDTGTWEVAEIPTLPQSKITNLESDLAGKQGLDAQLTSLAAISYSGNGEKVVRVNATEDGFEVATITGSGATEAQVMAHAIGAL